MARAVYSSQFIVYTTSEPNTQFDVPEGFTAVIRQFMGYVEAGLGGVLLYIQNSPEAAGCGVAYHNLAGVTASFSDEMRVIVPEGGVITFDVFEEGENVSGYVGGYLLRND